MNTPQNTMILQLLCKDLYILTFLFQINRIDTSVIQILFYINSPVLTPCLKTYEYNGLRSTKNPSLNKSSRHTVDIIENKRNHHQCIIYNNLPKSYQKIRK